MCPRGQPSARFRFHGLRSGRGRGVSTLARSTNQGALGRRRPGELRWNRRGEAQILSAYLWRARKRIKIFISLRLETLDRYALEKRVREIGNLRVVDEEPLR